MTTDIYHHKNLGHIALAIGGAIIERSKQSGPLTMCFNGTLVVIDSGDDSDTVYKNWITARDDYQKQKQKQNGHPALCPKCNTEEPKK